MEKQQILQMKNITKTFFLGDQSFEVLKGLSLNVCSGDFLAIMGASGSGKSTLMNIIGLLDICSSGEYYLYDKKIESFSEDQLSLLRRNHIGFVFQGYNLMKRFPAWQQVALPLAYQGVPFSKRKEMAIEALTTVGLADKIDSLPNQLSGGQQQRVCIARAIVTNASILLADEPTGALDSTTGKEVLELFQKLNNQGKTIILITHDSQIAQHAQTTLHIKDGLFIK